MSLESFRLTPKATDAALRQYGIDFGNISSMGYSEISQCQALRVSCTRLVRERMVRGVEVGGVEVGEVISGGRGGGGT